MCVRVQCNSCGKATWAGCGAHVASVMAGVPAEAQCRCREQAASSGKPQDAPKKRRFFGL